MRLNWNDVHCQLRANKFPTVWYLLVIRTSGVFFWSWIDHLVIQIFKPRLFHEIMCWFDEDFWSSLFGVITYYPSFSVLSFRLIFHFHYGRKGPPLQVENFQRWEQKTSQFLIVSLVSKWKGVRSLQDRGARWHRGERPAKKKVGNAMKVIIWK